MLARDQDPRTIFGVGAMSLLTRCILVAGFSGGAGCPATQRLQSLEQPLGPFESRAQRTFANSLEALVAAVVVALSPAVNFWADQGSSRGGQHRTGLETST